MPNAFELRNLQKQQRKERDRQREFLRIRRQLQERVAFERDFSEDDYNEAVAMVARDLGIELEETQ